MPLLLDLLSSQFLVFTLVLTRVSGLAIVAPVYGTNEVPAQVRGLLAFALALLLTPAQLGVAIDPPRTILNYLVLIGGEVLIGLTLGVGVLILFSGVQLAGQVIAQMSGLSLADVFNPGFDTSVPLISQFLYMFALAIYVISGGHRILMAGLLGTFSSIPPGSAGMSTSIADAMSVLVTESFTLGVRAAAPATVALLLATLVMGLISRTLPQLNIMAVGFGLNAMVTFGSIAVSLGGLAWMFQEQIEPAVEMILEVFQGSG